MLSFKIRNPTKPIQPLYVEEASLVGIKELTKALKILQPYMVHQHTVVKLV